MRPVAWILAAALIPPPIAALPGAQEVPPGPRPAVLALVHDGRFDTARKLLPDGAGPPPTMFLKAFVSYWNLIFDDQNAPLQDRMDGELNAVLAATEDTAAGDGPEAYEAALWAGTSHLILAELRASQHHPLGAAFEAKKAKKLLERSIPAGTPFPDALFGLGTYNYMADQVPRFIRGLRFLLGIPKGDRDLGLTQLEAAAETSPTFGFESRVLLVTIYVNRHERKYEDALKQASLLLAMAPDTIGSLYCAARVEVSLGRNTEALTHLVAAQARARTLPDIDPVVVRCLELLRAKAEFQELRPDLAAATASAALAAGSGLPPAIKDDLEEVRGAGAYNAPGIDWAWVETSGSSAEGAEALARLAATAPSRPLLALLAGDAFLRQRRGADAAEWLKRADTPTLPAGLVGPRLLRQGQAADLLGQREKALAFYKRAADIGGFEAKEAAVYYQATPYAGAP